MRKLNRPARSSRQQVRDGTRSGAAGGRSLAITSSMAMAIYRGARTVPGGVSVTLGAMTDHLIAHLDMDAFYASVELLRYPELRGKPVVIGGGSRHQPEEIVDPIDGGMVRRFASLRGYVGRGVITTATYEARALGLHSAQGLMKAARLAPDAILLPTDFERYHDYSRRFKAAVRVIAPQIEDSGIDEIYIDLTGVRLPEHDAGAATT